jgi:Predicted transcriptional regulator
MQEIARRLDLTDTEAFRQLQRLNEAQIIQKQLDGAYTITQYGRLLLQFTGQFEFAYKFKQTILTRDLWRIPEQFINRMGELADSTLGLDTNEMLDASETLIGNAESYLWIMGNRPLNMVSAKINERFKQSKISIRFIFSEDSRKYYENTPDAPPIFEKRVIPAIPAILIMTEKFAGVNLLSVDGRNDNAILYSCSPKFLCWASDLFQYYWAQGKKCCPSK